MRKNPLSNMSAHGGVITSEFLELIRGDKVANPRVQPESFVTFNVNVPPKDKRELDRQIEASFKQLLERWDALSSRYLKMSVSEARSKWMVPLFKELGFDPGFNREDIIVDGDDKLRFRLSHRGWISAAAPMVHMVAPSQDLEEAGDRAEGAVVRRGRSRSPHDEMQTYLNVSKGSRWGIVTNGVLLRVLREYYHTTTKGYVEFDVENIFRERSFTDFRAMYRMVHASRFLPDKDGLCPLEQFYKESIAAGVTIGENLRRNVKKAIEALGNGFLTPALAKKMVEDGEFCKAYYAELLRVIYRLLFLLFAEQRAMLPTRDSLYAEEYSITRLREMAETRRGNDDHSDLWEGLKVTFQMLKKGCLPLKVFGYNGSLFDDSELVMFSGLSCKNEDILGAIRHLTLVEEEHVLKRINYLDLGVSEIGSIYESLLDFSPKVFATEQNIEGEKIPANRFFLDPRSEARRASGSYYTNPRLIDELVKSALKPVVEDRLNEATEKEKALLSIKICDPACGSGAFLIAANNFLAKELARLRSDQTNPADKEVKKATRDVLQHCIYGVDLNPMATELAKVSLWINSCVEDLPLNFLDHHIKCGNSLIGSNPELLKRGILDETFSPTEDDDKEFAKKIKMQNNIQRQDRLMAEFYQIEPMNTAKNYASLDDFVEEKTEDVEEKRKRYIALMASPELERQKVVADCWAAAFFWALRKEAPNPPTNGTLRLLQYKGMKGIDQETKSFVEELASKYHFFHWHLEFPDVFEGKKQGFDCILGNPPWEKIRLESREWFAGKDQSITNCESESARTKMIENLEISNPALYAKWKEAQFFSRKLANFVRASGVFRFTKIGDSNTFALFSEHARSLINSEGRIGLVVKTGIATDQPWKDFFGDLITTRTLSSLYDFQNKELLFKDVAPVERFCLITITGKNLPQTTTEYAFLLTNPDQLADSNRRIKLESEAIEKINPNTKTLPSFQSQRDAEIVTSIHNRWPILFHEESKMSPWGAECYTTIVHMTMNANVFQDNTLEALKEKGFALENNAIFTKDEERFLPLWEAKLFNQFDHRFATFDGIPQKDRFKRRAGTNYPTEEQKQDQHFEILPRYWVSESDFLDLTKRCHWHNDWMFAFRGITRMTTDTRSTMGTIIPWNPLSYSAHVIFFRNNYPLETALLFTGVFTSIVLDYVLRQKIGGTNLSAFIVNQLPVPPPDEFDKFFVGDQVVSKYISDRVLKLVWTSHSLDCLGSTLSRKDGPFIWNNNERRKMRTEIDAVVAKVYGIRKEELVRMCNTFRIQKNKDVKQFGSFRTLTDILEVYDSCNLIPKEKIM